MAKSCSSPICRRTSSTSRTWRGGAGQQRLESRARQRAEADEKARRGVPALRAESRINTQLPVGSRQPTLRQPRLLGLGEADPAAGELDDLDRAARFLREHAAQSLGTAASAGQAAGVIEDGLQRGGQGRHEVARPQADDGGEHLLCHARIPARAIARSGLDEKAGEAARQHVDEAVQRRRPATCLPIDQRRIVSWHDAAGPDEAVRRRSELGSV